MRALWVLLLAVVFSSTVASSVAHADRDLPIEPVVQQTPVWCWLAVGEMVFRSYDVPTVNPGSYQCGIVAAMSLATNMDVCAHDCRKCVVAAGTASTLLGMLADYPRRAAGVTGHPAPRLFASVTEPLSVDELTRELDAGRPVIAGITPNPSSSRAAPRFQPAQHVALIVGYQNSAGGLRIHINDPFPFPTGINLQQNPYLAAGGEIERVPGGAFSYWIPYDAFRTRLLWSESYLVRADGWQPDLHPHAGTAMPTGVSSTRHARCVTGSGSCEVAHQPSGNGCACVGEGGLVAPGTVESDTP